MPLARPTMQREAQQRASGRRRLAARVLVRSGVHALAEVIDEWEIEGDTARRLRELLR